MEKEKKCYCAPDQNIVILNLHNPILSESDRKANSEVEEMYETELFGNSL